MSFDVGFDFRATSGFVTDPASSTGVIAASTETYPHTATVNGFSVTYGWDGDNTSAVSTRDRSAGVDARLAGINFGTFTASPPTFRVDLPATGAYNISLAIGDATGGNAQTNYLTASDNSTAFITFAPISTDATHFADAAGNFWTTAAWPGSNVTVSRTFSSTILKVKAGDGVNGTAFLAHLRVTQASAGFTAKFRKTLSPVGTRVGSRQVQQS